MARMAQYMEAHTPNFEAGAADFFQTFGLAHKNSIQDYSAKKIKEDDLVHPIFTNYKMVSLD